MNRKKYLTKGYLYRCIIITVSMMLNGLGLSLMRISCMGTDPFTSMNYSISEYFGISLGIVVIAVNAALLIISFFTMKSSVGFGTIANMALMGTSADFWGKVIREITGASLSFEGMEALPLRIALLCIGILWLMFFTSFYISGNLGMAPYDALGYIIEKISGRIPFKWARVVTDIVCVTIAYFVAGKSGKQWELIGIGTIIMAFGTGPLLAFLNKNIAQPFIERVCK